jgi:alpha-beta hydrolase superfamily lysophospholipase
MVSRIAKARGMWSSAVLTWDFIAKTYRQDPAAARRLFFSDAMPAPEVERLMRLLAAADGPAPVVDVRALGGELPVPRPARTLPGFVLGGGADSIVDEAGLAEAAAAIGAGAPTVLPGLAHDLMLDVGWEAAAAALAGWLEKEFV